MLVSRGYCLPSLGWLEGQGLPGRCTRAYQPWEINEHRSVLQRNEEENLRLLKSDDMRLTSDHNGLYGLKGLGKEKEKRAIQKRRRCCQVPGPEYYLITRVAASKLSADTLAQV